VNKASGFDLLPATWVCEGIEKMCHTSLYKYYLTLRLCQVWIHILGYGVVVSCDKMPWKSSFDVVSRRGVTSPPGWRLGTLSVKIQINATPAAMETGNQAEQLELNPPNPLE
jgi:hypothetical protein